LLCFAWLCQTCDAMLCYSRSASLCYTCCFGWHCDGMLCSRLSFLPPSLPLPSPHPCSSLSPLVPFSRPRSSSSPSACVHLGAHVCTRVYVHRPGNVSGRACTLEHTRARVCTHAREPEYPQVDVESLRRECMHTRARVCTRVHVHSRTLVDACACLHAHACTCVHACARRPPTFPHLRAHA